MMLAQLSMKTNFYFDFNLLWVDQFTMFGPVSYDSEWNIGDIRKIEVKLDLGHTITHAVLCILANCSDLLTLSHGLIDQT